MAYINNIVQVLDFFTKLLGEDTEIVVHDLKQHKIVWISNGHITERAINYKDDLTTMNITRARVTESPYEDMIVGASSYTKGAVHLRSSTLFLKDDNGMEEYAICVNQDLTVMDMMQKYLAQFGTTSTLERNEGTDDSIESLTKQLIFEEIEREKPFSSDSREAKLAIIQRLEEKGVFDVKGAVTIVCELLQIAQPTLYKYLKLVKNQE